MDNYRETTGNTIGLCFNVPANPASMYPRITFHTQGYTQRSNCMKTTEKRSISAAKPVGELLPKKLGERTKPKPLSRVQKRGIEASTAIALDLPDQIGYQHTVLCQTSMPYRDPGKAVREWEREQGAVSLRLEAGHAQHPETKEWVPLGLPFGPKSRLLLAHLNAEALKTGSPVVKIEESLTAFVRRIQNPTKRRKAGPNGYEIRAFKDHLARLSAAVIRMAVSTEERFIQTNSQIVDAFDLWFPKNKKQRVFYGHRLFI